VADDYEDDGYQSWTWGDPDAPDAIRHAMASLDGPVPCCGVQPLSLPVGEWMTADPARVNCSGWNG
jgi:hypothetical protein